MRIIIITPYTFAFAFAKIFLFGGCFLPAGRADVPDRVEEYTALRTIGKGVRRRGPYRQELKHFRWDIRIEMWVLAECWERV